MDRLWMTVAAALLCVSANTSVAEPMRFWRAHNGGNCNACVWLAGDGEITAATPEALEDLLATNPAGGSEPRDALILNSTGGDDDAALRLGRLIRARGLRTAVGATRRAEDDPSHLWTVRSGECAGACLLAYLGGVRRYYDPASASRDVGAMPDWVPGEIAATDVAQRLVLRRPADIQVPAPSAAPDAAAGTGAPGTFADGFARGVQAALARQTMLVNYAGEMGADPALVHQALALEGGAGRTLSREFARQWRVSTAPTPSATWRLEQSGRGLALAAEGEVNEYRYRARVACRAVDRAPPTLTAAFSFDLQGRVRSERDAAALRDLLGPASWEAGVGLSARSAAQVRWAMTYANGFTTILADLPAAAVEVHAARGPLVLVLQGPMAVLRGFPEMRLALDNPRLIADLLRRNCP